MTAAIFDFPKPQGQLRPVAQSGPRRDRPKVELHGLVADADYAADGLIACAVSRQQPQDIALSWRQLDPLCCTAWFAAFAVGIGTLALIGFGIASVVG